MDDPVPDEELMLRYGQGDAAAFETLYRRNKDGLYRFMLRQCGRESVTEELFQEVWLKVINARDRYRPSAGFRTWLFQIARNRVIDHFRHSSRTPEGFSTSEDGLINAIPGRAQQQPEQRTEMHQSMDSLLTVLEQLPAEQREVFLLKEEAGLSLKEIAEVTGLNEETAKSRLRYAINKIRSAMVREDV